MPSEKTFDQYLAGYPAPPSLSAKLVDKYSRHAMYHGDVQIKKDATSAKRTATLLSKTASQFVQLTDNDYAALKAAACAMRVLATDLVVLGAWARRFKAYYEKERKAERLAHFKQRAAARWVNTAERDFELALADELHSKDGLVAFANWQHSRNKYLNISADNFYFGDFRPECYDFESDFPAHIKHLTALENRAFNDPPSSASKFYYIQRSDFETYLAFRKTLAQQTSVLLAATAKKPL